MKIGRERESTTLMLLLLYHGHVKTETCQTKKRDRETQKDRERGKVTDRETEKRGKTVRENRSESLQGGSESIKHKFVTMVQED